MKKQVYLDNNATTPVDPLVLDAMMPYLTDDFGNPSNTLNEYGISAKNAVDLEKKIIADFLSASFNDIYFTSGSTESNNLVLKGIFYNSSKKNPHIITSSIEHPSVIETCRFLERQGARITYVPVNSEGFVDVSDIKSSVCDETILISIMAANNEIGTIQPIKEIGELAHYYRIPFHTDATQYIPLGEFDVNELNVDLMSFSAHKIYGPKGIGGVYIRNSLTKRIIVPEILGGGQQNSFRSGTLNVAGIVGMGEAIKQLSMRYIEDNARINQMRNQLLCGLQSLYPIKINGSMDNRIPSNLNVIFPGITSVSIISMVSDVAMSIGSACSVGKDSLSHVLTAIGDSPEEIQSSVRLSVGRFNKNDDISFTISAFKRGLNQILHN